MTQWLRCMSQGLMASLSASTLANVFPKGEWLVATALGVYFAEIWPSRYFDDSGILLDRKARRKKGLRQGK
ncbi:hypothetical protein BIY29_13815 [Brenneria alni]|uniref:Ner winged helix-turn-helix DNA-binding domain-containing protein n=1 Tax=Brenneria alni TaxID=71656 RepID=A0A421DLR2_9GAMM|nr:hypothetical protein BIY29_13815 [Brenneria alni]